VAVPFGKMLAFLHRFTLNIAQNRLAAAPTGRAYSAPPGTLAGFTGKRWGSEGKSKGRLGKGG